MSPQKSSQSSPKLHQYFQDIDLTMIGGGLRNVWLMDVEAGKVFQKFGDWRLKTKKVVGVMRVGPISSTSHIGTNGRFLVRASNAGRLLVEELLTGKLIAQIQLQDKVGAVRFADDRQNGEKACYLAAASINGQYVCEINGGGHKLKSIKNAEKTSKIKWIAEKTEFVSISNGNCMNYSIAEENYEESWEPDLDLLSIYINRLSLDSQDDDSIIGW
uniref:Uncharacterized protein n=1 Tax=Ditylenchus dipsaci TaxID=166011 RepID=A0A915E2L6_9BILA